jgi:2,5-dihydroxypyridine 5,6-dioxygenase
MRVTSGRGTDLTVDLRGAPAAARRVRHCPGAVAHWPAAVPGLPRQGCGERADRDGRGRHEPDVQDLLTSRIDFTIENDFVTAIKGDGIDALHLRSTWKPGTTATPMGFPTSAGA